MWNDIRFAIRTLRRSPAFITVAVLSLALGIGANTSIFSLLYQVLLRSLPVSQPEQLVAFHSDGPQSNGSSSNDNYETVFSYPVYKDLRDRSQTLSGVIARSSGPVSLTTGSQTERASAEVVSGNFFEVLGVKPVLGRLFSASDDRTFGAHPVIVLGHNYWTSHFGASPAALNQKVLVNGNPMVVVGVAPPGFRGVLTGQTPDLYVPIAMKEQVSPGWAAQGRAVDSRSMRWLTILARLQPGVSRSQAQVSLQPLYKSILREETEQTRMSGRKREQFLAKVLELRPAAEGLNSLSRQWRTPLAVLMVMVCLLLLIACANIASLLIARATSRRREIAVRLAMGAHRFHLVRQLLVESLLIAVIGGLLGLAFSAALSGALLRLLPEGEVGGWLTANTDFRLFGFSLALSLLTGLLFGLIPALQSTRPDLAPALKEQTTNASSSAAHAHLRRVLVVIQISVSLLLLVGAGLFTRSFVNLLQHNPGFHAENLLTFSVDPKLSGYTNPRSLSFYHDLQGRLAVLPGVRLVSSAQFGPFMNSNRSGNVTVEGYQAKEGEDLDCSQTAIGPAYFKTLSIPLAAGRELTEKDTQDAPKVAIVNETFARYFFGDRNPLGRHMAMGGGNNVKLDMEIVGVVKDSQGSLREAPKRFVYFPYTQDPGVTRMTFFVRTARNEHSLAPVIRTLVRQMDANLPLSELKSMQVYVQDSIYTDRLIATLAAAFGILAMLLAAIGLYGVIAYNVTRRTAEIGIRIALGAERRNVLGLVMKEVVLLAAIGLVIGGAVAFALSRYVESELFGLKANDPLIFTAATLLLGIVALFAGLIPAQRATRIDPIRALRYE